MDAIILAAGLGTRLRPYTYQTPKPLLTIRNRPILDWTLGALPRAVDRVLVVVNYLAEQIETYLAGQTHFTNWVTVPQATPRGTGDALHCCRDHLRSDRFMVLNGDDLYGAADLAALAACSAGLLVHQVDEPRRFGIAFLRRMGPWNVSSRSPIWMGSNWPMPACTCSRVRCSTFLSSSRRVGSTRSPIT